MKIKIIGLVLIALLLTTSQTGANAQSDPALRMISQTPGGSPGNGPSYSPSVSADGQFIAFVSEATDLTMGNDSRAANIFLWDQATQKSRIISLGRTGEPANASSSQPVISANGRWIVFTSLASDLVAEDTNAAADVFAYDRQSGKIERISVDSQARQAQGQSSEPAISADGRFVAFRSNANNLTPGDLPPTPNVFLKDRQTGQVVLVSSIPGSSQDGGAASHPSISADSRYITFLRSSGDRLAGSSRPGAFNGQTPSSLWRFDRLTGALQSSLITYPLASLTPAASADGNLGIFSLFNRSKFLIQDWSSRRTTSLSAGSPGNKIGYALSGDGQTAFLSGIGAGEGLWAIHWQTQQVESLPLPAGLSIRGQLAASLSGQWIALSAASQNPGANLPAQIYLLGRGLNRTTAFIDGWVTTELGDPMAGVTIADEFGHAAKTRRDGSFSLPNVYSGWYNVQAEKDGYLLTPSNQKVLAWSKTGGAYGITFSASPQGILQAARKDLGMPYAMNRGCPSPYTGCNGPFNGFHKGVCTDLILDAYRSGAGWDMQSALITEHANHPEHLYKLMDARNTDDMWNYFVNTGQMSDNQQPYLPGDAVFFDWDGDGSMDHVSMVETVDAAYRPVKLLDAPGAVEYNPGGLAAEVRWSEVQTQAVMGHARWTGK